MGAQTYETRWISHRLGQIKKLVRRSGTRVSAPVAGNGYLEMTGYGESCEQGEC